MGLDGPSRTIIVEPKEAPAKAPPTPAPDRAPASPPATPAEPEKVPVP